MTNVAAKVRAEKERRPENFCADPRCLWRVVTRDGIKPCPRHPNAAPRAERELAVTSSEN